jgi:hypothetical protein
VSMQNRTDSPDRATLRGRIDDTARRSSLKGLAGV